ncbi:MAG: AbrB/MazE/SpoVT family DNA-binding domain-containing protein [Defluviitaleaceae bacterium]|nr:AbrB/MazE/SpoVT family DNA-binding domain-containing protein [Defluviitaleaceae bacterium]
MNLAKVSTNGQVTIPMEVRRALNLKPGDKIIFLQDKNGDFVIASPNINFIEKIKTHAK